MHYKVTVREDMELDTKRVITNITRETREFQKKILPQPFHKEIVTNDVDILNDVIDDLLCLF